MATVKKVAPKASVKKAPVKTAKVKLVSLEGLTGLALHRAKVANAKAQGKTLPTKKGATSTRVPLPLFMAPSDFKPHDLEVTIKTEKDGLLANAIKATRYQGRYNPEAEDKKKADLGSYDPFTLMGILSRLSAVTYATNVKRRLPPNAPFKILMRVGKKAKDGSISVSIKKIWQGIKSKKSGNVVATELERSDPYFRAIRKSSRLLPAAFTKVLMPPKRVRGKRVEADDE